MNLKCTWVSTKQGVWCLGVLVEKHCWTENPFSKWEAICSRKQPSCVSLIVWCNEWWLSLNRLLISHECPIGRMLWCSEMLSFHYFVPGHAIHYFPIFQLWVEIENPWGVGMRFHVLKEQSSSWATEMERYIIVSHNLGHQTLANLKAIREHFLEPCSGVFFSHFCSLKPQTVTSAEIFFKSLMMLWILFWSPLLFIFLVLFTSCSCSFLLWFTTDMNYSPVSSGVFLTIILVKTLVTNIHCRQVEVNLQVNSLE